MNKNENKRKLESTPNIREGSTDNCHFIMQGNNGLRYRVILHDNFEGYIIAQTISRLLRFITSFTQVYELNWEHCIRTLG